MNSFVLRFVFLFFVSLQGYSQDLFIESDTLIDNFNRKKINDYFEVEDYFKDKKLSEGQLSYLIEVAEQSNNHLGEIYAYNVQGYNMRMNGYYEKSIIHYVSALQRSRKYKESYAEIVILNEIATVYRKQDKIRSALNYYEYALELADKIDVSSPNIKNTISRVQNGIGNIYLELKQYDLAIYKFKKVIKNQEEVGNKKDLAINHQNIGRAFQHLGYIDSALHHYNKSLIYNKMVGSTKGKIICHNSISNALALKGKFEEALKKITKVANWVDDYGDAIFIAQVYNTLGYCQIKMKDLVKAEKNIQKALFTAQSISCHVNMNISFEYLSEIYRLKNNYKKAYEYYKKSIEGREMAHDHRDFLYVNNLNDKYDSEVKNNKIKSLAKENEITKLKLTRNRNILIIALVSIALFGVLLYAIYGQRLLSNEKKILMLEQEALQSQMNPHFVFNALNSIKLYIINNEQKNAVYYLSKFSKLIRSILESSKIKEVTLLEELNTMNLYMSIENIRFSNEIIYDEEIDSTMNLEKIKVPPLILQPFIENAIWHGLSSKKGRKKIFLSIKKVSDDFIQIEILDNGIGREEAFKIKQSKSINRRSFGLELTKKRLENFSNGFNNHYSLSYTDLKNDKNQPIGTKVILMIPIR